MHVCLRVCVCVCDRSIKSKIAALTVANQRA